MPGGGEKEEGRGKTKGPKLRKAGKGGGGAKGGGSGKGKEAKGGQEIGAEGWEGREAGVPTPAEILPTRYPSNRRSGGDTNSRPACFKPINIPCCASCVCVRLCVCAQRACVVVTPQQSCSALSFPWARNTALVEIRQHPAKNDSAQLQRRDHGSDRVLLLEVTFTRQGFHR